MASPIGLGDVVTIAQTVYKLYKFFADAPEEIESACRISKEIGVLLGHYKNPDAQPPFLKSPAGKTLCDLINEQLASLKDCLKQLRRILKIGKSKWDSWVERIYFIARYKKTIGKLAETLRNELTVVHANFQAATTPGVAIDQAVMKQLEDMVKKQLSRAKLGPGSATKRENEPAIDEKHVGESIKTCGLEAFQKPTMDPKQRGRLVKELSSAGMTLPEAEEMIDTYHREASRLTSKPSAPKSTAGGKAKAKAKDKDKDKDKVKADRTPSPKPPNLKNPNSGSLSPRSKSPSGSTDGKLSPRSKSPGGDIQGRKSPNPDLLEVPGKKTSPPKPESEGKSATTNKNKKSSKPSKAAQADGKAHPTTILIVDEDHSPRAVMAQLYLEMLRVWSANHGQPWLFHNVKSAGLMVESHFRKDEGRLLDEGLLSPAGGPVSSAALKSLFIRKNDFATDDEGGPKEKQEVLRMMKAQRRQGLQPWFCESTYIICFDKTTVDSLYRLYRIARPFVRRPNNGLPRAPTSQIIHLDGCPTPADDSEKALMGIARPLRDMLKDFLRIKLNWQAPTGHMTNGSLRTQIVQLHDSSDKDLVIGKDSAEIRKLEKKSGCTMHVNFCSRGYGWTLAIVGEKGSLPKAVKMVQDAIDGDEESDD